MGVKEKIESEAFTASVISGAVSTWSELGRVKGVWFGGSRRFGTSPGLNEEEHWTRNHRRMARGHKRVNL